MKYLLLTLLLIGCGQETKLKDVPDLSKRSVKPQTTITTMGSSLQSEVEIFVAFLWPLEISQSQIKDVELVLDLGRSLRSGNESLLGVKAEFETLKCEQILAGDIIVTMEEEDYCYDLEDRRSTLTVTMLEKVQTMKQTIEGIDGEWLDSNQDFDSSEVSQIDFEKNTLSIYSMGSINKNEEKLPVPYPKLPFQIKSLEDYSFLEMSFPRSDADGLYSVKADIIPRKYSVIFQGDLDLFRNGSIQRGIIYWQVLKKSSLL